MQRARAAELGVRSIADLHARGAELSIGGDYEFFSRPEWAAVRRGYGLSFREQRSMDPSLMYQAVASGAVDVISAFSSDGRIAAFDLVVLEDERHLIPPYDAIVLVGRAAARRHPQLVPALSTLAGTINAQQMRQLNLAVDIRHELPGAVARAFAERALAPVPPAGSQ
jgi:osmoprotectant transport system permease protein